MQQAFIDLFTTGTSPQKWAFWIILGITFLLGMLVWALLMHYPALRKLRKEKEKTDEQNVLLEKENKDYAQKNTVLAADLKRSQESLSTAEANLKEKTEKSNSLSKELSKVSEERTLYKDNARSYKENYEELMSNFQTVSNKKDKLESQLEGLKGIVEEVEKEKEDLKSKTEESINGQKHADEKTSNLTQRLVKANETIELLKKDLDEAMAQKAELKKMAFELEASNHLDGSNDEELKEKVVRLQSHVRDLESENNDLLQKIIPYVNEEKAKEKEAEDMEQMMAVALADAEYNMANDGFFVGYAEKDLIEDKAYLEKTLAEEKNYKLPTEEEEEEDLALSEEEQLEIDNAELMANEAMSLQGFYNEIEEAVLIEREVEGAPELTAEEEDAMLEKQLEETAKLLEDNVLYQEDIDASSFIENQELHDKMMQHDKDNPLPVEEEVAVIELDNSDHEEMDRALENAMQTMKMEGLYAPISEDKLVGVNEIDEMTSTVSPLYASEVEQIVVNEVGKSIPAATNRKDDLKKIDGIGMFLEEQLNYFGIYTFEQVAAFDTNFIDKLTAAIGFSEDTIYRDEWVAQAQKMSSSN